MEKENIIAIEDISFSYQREEDEKRKNAVDHVTLHFEKGSFTAILGKNGSGKSTLAKHLNGLLVPGEGIVYVGGFDTREEEHIWDVRQTAGMVFQNPDNQLVATIVEEDVAFGPENLGLEPAEIRRRVDEALSAVGMSEYAKKEPHRLSGGQKQRVAIAGIIAMMPECMIFDESTAMLDPSGRREVVGLMEKLNRERGITVINITHLMSEAARADRILVINQGELIGEGTPKEIFSDARLVAVAGLELPQSSRLLHALHDAGVDIDVSGITASECADRIVEAIEKRKSAVCK